MSWSLPACLGLCASRLFDAPSELHLLRTHAVPIRNVTSRQFAACAGPCTPRKRPAVAKLCMPWFYNASLRQRSVRLCLPDFGFHPPGSTAATQDLRLTRLRHVRLRAISIGIAHAGTGPCSSWPHHVTSWARAFRSFALCVRGGMHGGCITDFGLFACGAFAILTWTRLHGLAGTGLRNDTARSPSPHSGLVHARVFASCTQLRSNGQFDFSLWNELTWRIADHFRCVADWPLFGAPRVLPARVVLARVWLGSVRHLFTCAGPCVCRLFVIAKDTHPPGIVHGHLWHGSPWLRDAGVRLRGAGQWPPRDQLREARSTTLHLRHLATWSIAFGGGLHGFGSASVASQPRPLRSTPADLRCLSLGPPATSPRPCKLGAPHTSESNLPHWANSPSLRLGTNRITASGP